MKLIYLLSVWTHWERYGVQEKGTVFERRERLQDRERLLKDAAELHYKDK